MTRTVRVAVLGLGRIGSVHAANLAAGPATCQLAAVVDGRSSRAREIGEELGVPWSSDPEAVLSDLNVDAVVVATPTPTHATFIEAAARHAKHVFCEKPVAPDAASARRALAAARAASIHLQVGFQRRFDRDLELVHEAIVAGELGAIRAFRSTHRNAVLPAAANPGALGGLLLDVGIHDFDLARWLVGEIDEVSVVGARVDGTPTSADEDAVHAVVVLRFANGALGVVELSRAAGYGFEASTEIVGERATVRVGMSHRANGVEVLTPGRVRGDLVTDHAQRHERAFARQLEGFVDAVRAGRRPAVVGEDADAAFMVAAAAGLSLRHRRTIALRHEDDLYGSTRYELADEALADRAAEAVG